MAKVFSDPGAYLNEIDNSLVPAGQEDIGACFIGLAEKGPAFVPTKVNTWSNYTKQFGEQNPNYYMPYALKGYLKYQSPATVIRVLGKSSYSLAVNGAAGKIIGIIGKPVTSGAVAPLTGCYSQSILFGEIYCKSANADGNFTINDRTGNTTTSINFSIAFTSSTSATTVITYSNLTLDPTQTNYIGNVLNTKVSSSETYYWKGGYGYWLPMTGGIGVYSSQSYIGASPYIGQYNSTEGSLQKYNNARTTWIQSQNFGSSSLISAITYDLFKVYNQSDGNSSNTQIKISFANIQASTSPSSSDYGTFDLLVRDFNDTDQNPTIYEQFINCNLDPTSDNYIARIIGDKYRLWNASDKHFDEYGNYVNKSKYVYVKMSDDISNVPSTAVPYGFEAYPVPVYIGVRNAPAVVEQFMCWAPALPTKSVLSVTDYYGIDFTKPIKDALNVSVTHSTNAIRGTTSGTEMMSPYYAVYDMGVQPSCAVDTITSKGSGGGHLTSSAYKKWRKFTVPMYKGWDGIDYSMTVDYNALPTNLENGYLDAISIAGEDSEADYTDIYIPGVSDSTVTTAMIDAITERADAFYVADIGQKTSSIATVQSNADAIDSSYVGCYFPWIQVHDSKINCYVWVPPSVLLASVIAYNDKVAAPWYPPAGLKRGTSPTARDTYLVLNSSDRSDLYSHGINPIANFRKEGIVVWGQKKLQKRPSALDRINVRRLVVNIKKIVKRIVMGMIFDQAGPEFWTEFIDKVTPKLEDIKNRKGLYSYDVIMDSSLNTAEVEAQRQVKGQIRITPTKAGEFINVDMIIDSTGVSFTS